MTGDALEQALALQRAPFLRQTLRTRPLPDDIGELIQIASGSPALLAEAARSSGETEARVLEAVRFMLQEALFFPDADAYRVLGVQRDAPVSQIREHYRWLQRWLHPDRRDGEWETVFATRVNAAWGQLRTAEARSRYDASRIQDRNLGLVAMVPRRTWMPNVEHPGPNRLRWLALGALSGCLLLAMLLLGRKERPPDWSGILPNPPLATKADVPTAASTRGETVSGRRLRTPVTGYERRAATLQPATAASATIPDSRPAVAAPAIPTSIPAIAAAPAPMPAAVESVPTPKPLSIPQSHPLPAPARNAPGQQVPIAIAMETPSQTEPVPGLAGERFDQMQRMQLAGHRTRQLVRYLGDPASRAPPIWNDLRSQLRAERSQRALQARLGDAGARITLELQDPHWRLGQRDAWLLTQYRVQGSQGRAEIGVLTVGMTWREGMWLVHEISLDPSS